MIRVMTVVRDGEIDFRFEPEAKFWVLYGASLVSVEASIRFAVLEEMQRVQPVHSQCEPIERITAAGQRAVDEMIKRGIIVG
jgi:hypothetical protein